MRKITVAATAAAIGCALALPAGANGPGTPDQTDHRASPPSPTTRDEPAVAVNPRNPAVVVTAANDYGDNGMAAYYSSDGGHTWLDRPLPMGNGANYGSDPNLAYDSAGRLFAAYVTFTENGGIGHTGGLTVARSLDGGRDWEATPSVPVRNGTTGPVCHFEDFPTIAVDARPGHDIVYVGWQELTYRQDCSTWTGLHLRLVRSTDHGRTWSRPVTISEPGGEGYIPRLSVGPDGMVYLTYAFAPTLSSGQTVNPECPSSDGPIESHVARSSDGGRHFRIAVVQRTCDDWTQLGFLYDPVDNSYPASYTGATYRLPANTNTTVDPRTGALVNVIGGQDPDTGVQQARVAYSRDHGRTWQRGGTVSGVPGENQQYPFVAAAPNGHLGLVYIAQLPGGFLVASHAISTDDGRTWTPATWIASVPSHVHGAFFLGFIGDYIGEAVGSDGLAHPVWTDLRELSAGTRGSFVEQPLDGGTIYTRSIRL